MNAVFDTLSYARRMEGVGFTRAQAEAMAEEQAKLIDERLATKADIAAVQADIAGVQANVDALRVSTKADIEALRLSTKADIEALRLSTRSDAELLRRDVVIRLGGIVIASVAAGSTIVTLLFCLPGGRP